MSQEVKRFFIMPGAVHVMQGDSPAYTPMTNHETLAHTVPVVLASDHDALLAERDALAKDAERYRWLRNPDQDVALVLDKMVSSGVYEYRAGDELDAAIDAAMQGDQQ